MTASQHLDIWRKGELQLAPARGDNFKDAVALTVGTTVSLSSVGATEDPVNDPYNSYYGSVDLHKNVWCTFTPPTPGVPYLVTVDGTAGSSAHTLYGYIDDSGLEIPGPWTNSNFNILNFNAESVKVMPALEAGQTYYMSIGLQASYTLNPGPFDITVSAFPPPPSNNNFAAAQTISVVSAGSVTGSTLASTIQDSQECVMTGCAEHTVWYKFTADMTGVITLDTCVGTLEYQYYGVAAWDATADGITTVADVDWTTPLAADVYSGSTGCGTIGIPVVNGHVYYVQVSQQNLLAGEDFTLSWSDITTPPANDALANATTISVVTGGTIAGTTVNATDQVPLETDYTSNDGSVWYKFQADATGNITLDTELSTTVDTAIMVFAGTASSVIGDFDFATPDFYAFDDDSGVNSTATITFAVTSGTWYYVQISDYEGGTTFTLRWSDIT